MAQGLARQPAGRLLAGFVCRGPGWFETNDALAEIAALPNLRVFQYGQEADPEEGRYDDGTQYGLVAPHITRMSRLEELRLFGHINEDELMWQDLDAILSSPSLSNLRVFQHYHGTVYPTRPFATNPALRNLTQILIYPHSFSRTFTEEQIEAGDLDEAEEMPALNRENVRHILFSPHLPSLSHLQLRSCSGGDGMIDDLISSGTLKRLRHLDLRYGHVTDAGAARLACPDARGLKTLDLIGNRLTAAGIRALTEAGISVRADDQEGRPYNDERLLYYGDSE
jgi:hypothetical protein